MCALHVSFAVHAAGAIRVTGSFVYVAVTCMHLFGSDMALSTAAQAASKAKEALGKAKKEDVATADDSTLKTEKVQ